MKRVFPFVVLSVLLSIIASRLVASGLLETLQARFEGLCDRLAERAVTITVEPAPKGTVA